MSELYYHKKRKIICRLIPFVVTIPSLATERQTAPKVLPKFTYLQRSSNAFLKTSLKLAHFVRHLLIVLPPYTLLLEIFWRWSWLWWSVTAQWKIFVNFSDFIFTLAVLVFGMNTVPYFSSNNRHQMKYFSCTKDTMKCAHNFVSETSKDRKIGITLWQVCKG